MNTIDFLNAYKINSDLYNFPGLVDECTREMKKGLAGSSSFLMIPSYIKMGNINKNTPVCVIDAGGSNLRIGRAEINDNGFSFIKDTFKTKMLGTEGQISGTEFFDRLSEMCLPYVNSGETISFCFSFPAEILPDLDARIIMFDKEVDIIGLENTLLGNGLKKALSEKGIKDVSIKILNDSVATCLAGMTEKPGDDTYIGTILGTGFNTCYFENASCISKSKDSEGQMIVNMESGGYSCFPRNDIDVAFDKTLKFPGHQLCEQLISGAYLGPLISATLIKAGELNTIKIIRPFSASTPDIDNFLRHKQGILAECIDQSCFSDAEIIINAMLKRAAMFAAVIMGSIVKRTNVKSACITIEGSTYYKLFNFKKYTDEFLCEFTDALRINTSIIEVDNAVLKGCTIAALL